MELALYCPDCGFYEAEGDKIGKAGDFFTSVSVGTVFGELLAFQFACWFDAAGQHQCGQHLGPGSPDAAATFHLVEAGAHDGSLARDILRWLTLHRPGLTDRLRYTIIEPSPARTSWQKRTLSDLGQNVSWVAGPQDLVLQGSYAIVFSNELFDAFPVHRFLWNSSSACWEEQGVGLVEGRFTWLPLAGAPHDLTSADLDVDPGALDLESLAACLLSALGDAAARGRHVVRPAGKWRAFDSLFSALPTGFFLEVSPAACQWWRTVARQLTRGKLLTLDYGYTADQFLVPERKYGTLRSYCAHQVTADILANPGEQDITAHVNFSLLRRAGEAAGLVTRRFCTQEKFLSSIVAEIIPAGSGAFAWDPPALRQLRTLLHPAHLGSVFRVLEQER